MNYKSKRDYTHALNAAREGRVYKGIASRLNTVATVKANIHHCNSVSGLAELCGVTETTMSRHLKEAGLRIVFKAVLERTD